MSCARVPKFGPLSIIHPQGPYHDENEARSLYDFVRFTYTDIHGISRSKTVCNSGFWKFFESGIGVHVGSVGFGLRGEYDPCVEVCETLAEAGYEADGNVFAKPLPGTLRPLSTSGGCKHAVGQVLCETFHGLTGQRQKELPRYIAVKQLKCLHEMGYKLFSSVELEFNLVDPKTLEPVFDNPGDMFVNLTIEKFDPVLMDIAGHLESIGVGVETIQTENSQGQFELVLMPQFGITTADHAIVARDCIKTVARSHGYKAVFMTKYCNDAEFCNSAHFNHSLIADVHGGFPFSDIKECDKLSSICRQWLGGLVNHIRALNAVCGPTVNCYRRLHRGPMKISQSDWGLDDRMATFRIKNYSPESTYIESRLPSGSSNPYLVMAATVAAGISGLRQQLPCPAPRPKFNTNRDNAGGNPYTEMPLLKLPETLQEGMQALKDDAVLTEALGPDFVKWFLLLKKDELSLLTGCDVTKDDPDMFEKERSLYLDLI